MFRCPFKFHLLSGEYGEQLLLFWCKSLGKFPVVAYKSKESSDLLWHCWWIHVLDCMCLRR